MPGNSRAELVDQTGTVAVRHNARIGHADAEGVLPLLEVARVDARGHDPDAYFAATWLRLVQIADDEDVPCRPLSFVPDSLHADDLR
jgi:hypothetical protein